MTIIEQCPTHPAARTNDFGGAYVLCAICSQQIPKRNAQVHPIFREVLNALTIPKRLTCHHPALQINDEGICCDCGAQVAP